MQSSLQNREQKNGDFQSLCNKNNFPNFSGIKSCYRLCSTVTSKGNPVITTHYSIKSRENDPRWQDIDMTREVAEYDVVIVGGGEFFTQCGNLGIFLIQILRGIKFDKQCSL